MIRRDNVRLAVFRNQIRQIIEIAGGPGIRELVVCIVVPVLQRVADVIKVLGRIPVHVPLVGDDALAHVLGLQAQRRAVHIAVKNMVFKKRQQLKVTDVGNAL